MKKNRRKKETVAKKEKNRSPLNTGRIAFMAASLAILTFLTLSPLLKGTFTNWDDDTYVTSNAIIQSSTTDWEQLFTEPVALNYHPLTMLTLRWNFEAAGLQPRAYLLTNLLLHVLNTVLVFLFFYFLSGRKIIAGAISGLLFGVHPMHVESVAWISERKDVLYVFFLLLSLLAYLRYNASKHFPWLLLCFVFFLLSCLSKAMAVVLPLLLWLTDYFQQRPFNRKTVIEKIPFLVTSLVFGLLAFRVQAGSTNETVQSFSALQQFFFGCYGCMMYLVKFLFPVHLSAFYPYPVSSAAQSLPVEYYLSPLVLLAGGLVLYRYFRRQSFVVYGALFFLVAVAPVLQFVAVGNALMADRYSYLSYSGLCFIGGYGIQKVYDEKINLRNYITVVVCAILIILGFISHQRTSTWNNSETLWTDVINKYPDVTTAYKNRGNYYGQKGNNEAALKDYQVLLDKKTQDPEVFNNLGNIYANQEKYEASLDAYSKAINLKPDYVNAYINRGISYNSLNQPEKAITDFSKAISLSNNKGWLWAQRGFTYYTTGQFDKAIADLSRAILLQPDLADAMYCRGLCYYRIGKRDAAVADLSRARAMGYNGDFSILNQ